jgi:Glycosyl transferases group 1
VDALAMPSRFEGLPLAALEAMAAGLPVVGCDAPGVRDAVVHGVTGWLAPIGDSVALARGLQLALAPETGPRWGRAARSHYELCFTAQRMAARHDRLYTQMLARCDPNPGARRQAPDASESRTPVTTGAWRLASDALSAGLFEDGVEDRHELLLPGHDVSQVPLPSSGAGKRQ